MKTNKLDRAFSSNQAKWNEHWRKNNYKWVEIQNMNVGYAAGWMAGWMAGVAWVRRQLKKK